MAAASSIVTRTLKDGSPTRRPHYGSLVTREQGDVLGRLSRRRRAAANTAGQARKWDSAFAQLAKDAEAALPVFDHGRPDA
jgi:hypothetical protein